MKIGVITKPNSKGQVVIPKEMRDILGIDASINLNFILAGSGIYIYPVKEVLTKSEEESSYLNLLKKTKGTWAGEDWDKLSKVRSKLELKASGSRKDSW